MHTANRRPYTPAIPNWGFETLRSLSATHRLLADIERGLRYAARLQGVDQRIGDKLQLVRVALGAMQVRLLACEHTTQQVLAEITEAPGQHDHQAGPGA